MIDYCHTIINELDDRINELTYEPNNSLVAYENAIVLVLQKLEEIKKYIKRNGFKDDDEEILFFKEVKPKIFCHLIYYRKVYNTEMHRPVASVEAQKEYLLKSAVILFSENPNT